MPLSLAVASNERKYFFSTNISGSQFKSLLLTRSSASFECVPNLLLATHLNLPWSLRLMFKILRRNVCPDCVITVAELFWRGATSLCLNQATDGFGMPFTLQENCTLVPSKTDWVDGPETTDGGTSVDPKEK